jgi:hypothetical protein
MAKSALFIGWGEPVPGREQIALGLFNEAMQYYQRLQQQGDIESFEPMLLEAHGGDLAGFILLRGDADKLARIRNGPEFMDFTTRAQLMLNRVGVVTAWYGEELQQIMAGFGRHVASLAR